MLSGREKYLSWKLCKHLFLIFIFSVAFLQVAPISASEYWPQTQWRTASPESQGMSSRMLSELFQAIEENDYSIDSVTISRNGYLVLEAYGPFMERHFKHQIHSCTKSVASALIGIAIDKGYIQSVDQTVFELQEYGGGVHGRARQGKNSNTRRNTQ